VHTAHAHIMSFLDHPAFQSLVLPFVLGVVSIGLLRIAGPRWAALGPALALVVTLAVWPGFDWPAASRVQKLPWIALGGALLAALAIALKAPGTLPWNRWTGVLISSVLSLAALGRAALGGSLLLAQLALILGTLTGVAALAAWRNVSPSAVASLPLLFVGIWIALSIAWLPPIAPQGTGASESNDPYYDPQWK
jgi:hypothetical protein